MDKSLCVFLCLILGNVKIDAITGGAPAAISDFPYHVALYNRFGHFKCSGALISVNQIQVVVTAVKCLDSEVIVAGAAMLNSSSEQKQERPVARDKSRNHPDYDPDTKHNDIGLIFPQTPFDLGNNIRPANLIQQNFEEPQGNIFVSGWGRVGYLLPLLTELHYIEIPTMRWEDCFDVHEAELKYQIIVSQFCSGHMPGGQYGPTPCTRDEGAPAVNDKGKLIGVYSRGYNCGRNEQRPAIYTKLSHFLDWIHGVVAEYKNTTAW